MKVALAGDHRGQTAKTHIAVLLSERGHEVVDLGTNSVKSCDYPDLAYLAARAVVDGMVERAVLFCGSGIGMTICANKIPGIRAALCHDELTAQMSRQHNDANVLCLASDVSGEELMRRIVIGWLETPFDGGGRHERRVRKVALIERGEDPSGYNADDLTANGPA
ncbi:MAG: ribose 5-phosphate isomerase B [Phycisphaerae bacterium]|nr:ribose 5-phosphate isomerase B [Phycisphaerae bacterium]